MPRENDEHVRLPISPTLQAHIARIPGQIMKGR